MNRLKSALAGFAFATFVTAGTLVCTQALLPGLAAASSDEVSTAHAMALKPGTSLWSARAHLKFC
jgi:hypothetical protein